MLRYNLVALGHDTGQPHGQACKLGEDDAGTKGVLVHMSTVQRAGLQPLSENQAVSYDLTTDCQSGKQPDDHLRTLQA